MSVLLLLTGRRGRPKVAFAASELHFLQKKGFTGKQMAAQLQCSPSLIYKHLRSASMPMRQKYDSITDAELEEHISSLHSNHSNAGTEVRRLPNCCCVLFQLPQITDMYLCQFLHWVFWTWASRCSCTKCTLMHNAYINLCKVQQTRTFQYFQWY